MKKRICFLVALALVGVVALAQDSVDVTFRYQNSGVASASVPGEFNTWNNAAWPMTNAGGGLWTRTARLRVGGNPVPTVPGAWQYKFFFPGASPWPNDPLNHHVNLNDNSNTFIYVKDPTIYHFLPNQRSGVVNTNLPTISAYIFPKVGTAFDTAALSVSIDGTVYSNIGTHYDFATKLLAFVPPAPLVDGSHTIILNAGANADTVNFVSSTGSSPILPLPGYAQHGVTLPSVTSNDSTTFRLRVGGSSFVILRIAPAGQPVANAPATFMRKNTSSDDWWMNVKLTPGTYEYQYQTSSGTMINDPWGRYSGTYGSRFTVGPEGLTADDYVWQTTNYQRPPLNKLVVYEMHVGEFAGGYYGMPAGQAGFPELATLLPYLDSLGVNAIELMPINDYGLIGLSGHSWGYDLSHYFAIEPAFGTPREFKALVDSAHARGIAVILDVVFNHLNDPSPLWQMQPNEATNPYFKLCNDLRYNEDQLCFFRDIDHWTVETQEMIFESLKMWIEEYRVDGFRYDYTQGIGWNIAEPTVGILGWSNRVAQEYNGEVYQIAEHLPESPALVYHSGITGGWHDSFRDEIFDEARFRNTPLLDFDNLILDLGAYGSNDTPALPNRYADRTEPVNANVTHDEQSLIYEMTMFQSVPLNEAILRDKLYATFMFTSLGIPMLWEGMEFSAPRGWTSDGQKLSYRPVEWNLYPTVRGQEHFAYYQSLIRQRKYNPALFNGALRKLFRYNTEKTLVWGFEDSTSGAKIMAIANLSTAQQTVTNVPWLAAGNWYDVFDQGIFVAPGTTIPSITLPAYTARVYSNVPDSVLLDVTPPDQQLPTEFALFQNYPNPFNPQTVIRFDVRTYGHTSLRVFDVLGREVATLVNEDLPAGTHQRSFDARGLASGVYLYRLSAGEYTETRKLVLMK
ncbi:MAG: alpha-amylase family glycosyl hydrolase [Bacteroidota bacterium]